MSGVFLHTKIKNLKIYTEKETTAEIEVQVCMCSVIQSCLTLCDPMDCSPPGFSAHGISQARILGWIAISSSRGSSQLRGQTCISCIGRLVFFTTEPPGKSEVRMYIYL